jgi:hypothetical protein
MRLHFQYFWTAELKLRPLYLRENITRYRLNMSWYGHHVEEINHSTRQKSSLNVVSMWVTTPCTSILVLKHQNIDNDTWFIQRSMGNFQYFPQRLS